jgi:hypothetical protein
MTRNPNIPFTKKKLIHALEIKAGSQIETLFIMFQTKKFDPHIQTLVLNVYFKKFHIIEYIFEKRSTFHSFWFIIISEDPVLHLVLR